MICLWRSNGRPRPRECLLIFNSKIKVNIFKRLIKCLCQILARILGLVVKFYFYMRPYRCICQFKNMQPYLISFFSHVSLAKIHKDFQNIYVFRETYLNTYGIFSQLGFTVQSFKVFKNKRYKQK